MEIERSCTVRDEYMTYIIMNGIFIALFQVLKALYNGSFIHTLEGEAPTDSLEAKCDSVS